MYSMYFSENSFEAFFAPDTDCAAINFLMHPCASLHEVLFMI